LTRRCSQLAQQRFVLTARISPFSTSLVFARTSHLSFALPANGAQGLASQPRHKSELAATTLAGLSHDSLLWLVSRKMLAQQAGSERIAEEYSRSK
jgi:hypothetical protein